MYSVEGIKFAEISTPQGVKRVAYSATYRAESKEEADQMVEVLENDGFEDILVYDLK